MEMIKEKAEAYDRAIKVAKDIRNGKATYIPNGTPVIDAIFPELKESEDERIRKELIQYFSNFNLDTFAGLDPKKILAWLEKQGEPVEINLVEILKHYPRETELYSPMYGKLWLAEVDEEHEIITCYKHRLPKGCVRAVLEQEDTISFYSNGTTGLPDFSVSKDCMLFLYDIEKQREIDEEKVLIGARKDVALSIMNFLDRCTLGMCLSGLERADLESAVIDSDWSKVYDYMKKKLEKQGEKPQGKSALEAIKEVKVDNANKVEPKFHEGDWVIYNNDICQIVKREEGCNKLVTVFGIEKELVNERNLSTARLWTIQDAKPGDVLANDHHILILKELDYDWSSNGTPSAVKAYCGIKPNGNFEIGKDNWCFCGTLHIHPATKEQRDLLFAKMKEAGYEWDEEKKELKKIEQTPANNVEPKFKVDDWIVYNRNNSSREVLYVYDIRDGRYYFNDNIHFSWSVKECDEKCHLWTIKDAKSGDVLASIDGEDILIFASLYSFTTFSSYYSIRGEWNFGWSNSWFIPATKEQRDTLLKAMADAGYTFDFDKKELKKIEDEEYNGEDYGIDGLWHAKNILEKTLGEVEGYQTDDGILDHKCAISAVNKLYKQKPSEWSEEDEEILENVISSINHDSIIEGLKLRGMSYSIESSEHLMKNLIDWLNSLKDRYTWKPSEEHIHWLKWAINRMPDTEKANEAEAVLKDLLEQLEEL